MLLSPSLLQDLPSTYVVLCALHRAVREAATSGYTRSIIESYVLGRHIERLVTNLGRTALKC